MAKELTRDSPRSPRSSRGGCLHLHGEPRRPAGTTRAPRPRSTRQPPRGQASAPEGARLLIREGTDTPRDSCGLPSGWRRRHPRPQASRPRQDRVPRSVRVRFFAALPVVLALEGISLLAPSSRPRSGRTYVVCTQDERPLSGRGRSLEASPAGPASHSPQPGDRGVADLSWRARFLPLQVPGPAREGRASREGEACEQAAEGTWLFKRAANHGYP